MNDAEKFLELLLGGGEEKRTAAQSGLKIRLARVSALAGGDKVNLVFDGEIAPSQKAYKCFTSYSPAVGDRAVLIGEYVIGGVRF